MEDLKSCWHRRFIEIDMRSKKFLDPNVRLENKRQRFSLISVWVLCLRYYTKLTCASYLVHISSFFDFFIIQCLKTLSDICGVEILAIEPPQLQHECNSQWAKLINFTQKVFKIFFFLTLLVFKFTQYRYLYELFLIIHNTCLSNFVEY